MRLTTNGTPSRGRNSHRARDGTCSWCRAVMLRDDLRPEEREADIDQPADDSRFVGAQGDALDQRAVPESAFLSTITCSEHLDQPCAGASDHPSRTGRVACQTNPARPADRPVQLPFRPRREAGQRPRYDAVDRSPRFVHVLAKRTFSGYPCRRSRAGNPIRYGSPNPDDATPK
jgi:hypothetical protein